MARTLRRRNSPAPKGIGLPLPWTDADLERLSEVTPEDITRAQALWRSAASPQYRDLLDAAPAPVEPPPAPSVKPVTKTPAKTAAKPTTKRGSRGR